MSPKKWLYFYYISCRYFFFPIHLRQPYLHVSFLEVFKSQRPKIIKILNGHKQTKLYLQRVEITHTHIYTKHMLQHFLSLQLRWAQIDETTVHGGFQEDPCILVQSRPFPPPILLQGHKARVPHPTSLDKLSAWMSGGEKGAGLPLHTL